MALIISRYVLELNKSKSNNLGFQQPEDFNLLHSRFAVGRGLGPRLSRPALQCKSTLLASSWLGLLVTDTGPL